MASFFAGEGPSRPENYERFDICRSHWRLLHRGRSLRPFLRETLGSWFMWNIIVGIISLLLFIYLFVAITRPEKF
jgi:K+-transporting ATPase KdpF subunit